MLTGATRLVGLLGHPVAHSLSPRMQNAAFAARGLDWAYVPLDVAPQRLEGAVAGLVALGFVGANVTIPHKTAVLGFCDELDRVAERGGSVNTLLVEAGLVRGSSTDGAAVCEAVEPAGARVVILGAGGAAQAVAMALLDAGAASLCVAARDAERAGALAARLRALEGAHDVEALRDWPPRGVRADLVVNATPVVDAVPVQLDGVGQVVDLAYRTDTRPTALVLAAQKAGCERVVDGLQVLVRQGAASFERWTGVPAPDDVMRAALTG